MHCMWVAFVCLWAFGLQIKHFASVYSINGNCDAISFFFFFIHWHWSGGHVHVFAAAMDGLLFLNIHAIRKMKLTKCGWNLVAFYG